MPRRVVVTGMGGLTALGHDWPTIAAHIKAGQSGIEHIHEWDTVEGLHTRLAAPVAPYQLPASYDRKRTRSMGPVALMSARSAELALADAGLIGAPVLTSGETGIAFGACAGSAADILDLARLGIDHSVRSIKSNTYLRMMSHTGAVNISVFFGITGRIIPTTSACASGSQAIGYAYETIQAGRQRVMIAGGAEELSVGTTAVFDRLYATSTRNDAPGSTPRPFDRDRDGLVIGEGATTLVLEDLEHARARGAAILAEVVGFGTNADGCHVTQPNIDTMVAVMRLALADAGLDAAAIGYVSAHGTATARGDAAESQATRAVMGTHVPISSMKSYFGHTLGACAALEAWLGIQMLREGWFAPTLNLAHVDPECADLDYIMDTPRRLDIEHFMSNNFAFGGINTSLIFRRCAD